MDTVTFETDNAVFHFDLDDVTESLNGSETRTEEMNGLLNHLLSSSDDPIKIPEKYGCFGYIALDLIRGGKGSVTCKICNKIYQPDQLKSTTVGHGKSPFSVNLNTKGGIIKRLFGKRQRLPGMFGGRGYRCPQGHELIAIINWRT